MVCVSQWVQNGCTVHRPVRLRGCVHFSQFDLGGAMATNEVLCAGVCLCGRKRKETLVDYVDGWYVE